MTPSRTSKVSRMLEELVLVYPSSRMRLWAVNIRIILRGLSKVATPATLAPPGVSNKVAMLRQHYGRTIPKLRFPHRFMYIVKSDTVGP